MSFEHLASFVAAKDLTEYQKFVKKKVKEKGIDEKHEMDELPGVMKEVDKGWKAKEETDED